MIPATLPKEVALGVVVLPVAWMDPDGVLWLHGPGTGPVPARCVATLHRRDLEEAARNGFSVVAALEGGDPHRPIALGILGPQPAPPAEAVVDGKTVTLTGRDSVSLRCGKASITLTKDGKVLIRGERISSRSSGVNRIRGGSVQIN